MPRRYVVNFHLLQRKLEQKRKHKKKKIFSYACVCACPYAYVKAVFMVK